MCSVKIRTTGSCCFKTGISIGIIEGVRAYFFKVSAKERNLFTYGYKVVFVAIVIQYTYSLCTFRGFIVHGKVESVLR